MNILIIRNYPSYMDINKNTYNIQEIGLAKALVRRGHRCDVLFWTNHEEKVIDFPVKGFGKILIFYKRGITLLKNTIFLSCDSIFEKYDILQPCEYNQIQSWLLAKKYSEKTIIYHGPYYSEFNKRYNLMCKVFDIFFLKTYIKKECKFLTKSRLAKGFLTAKGINQENIFSVGVGIDVQMLTNEKTEDKGQLFQKMNQDEGIKLLYIGRLEKRRNIPFILDILKAVLDNRVMARLYIIGTGDPKYSRYIFNYAAKIGLQEHIIWNECIEQKYLSEIYKLADFFLLPTLYEIFGMVLLEAMYYETVAISTPNGGSSELISNGMNGFILKADSADNWAQCIIDVYKDKERFNLIKKAAGQMIETHFTWDMLAEKFERNYYNMIKHG